MAAGTAVDAADKLDLKLHFKPEITNDDVDFRLWQLRRTFTAAP